MHKILITTNLILLCVVQQAVVCVMFNQALNQWISNTWMIPIEFCMFCTQCSKCSKKLHSEIFINICNLQDLRGEVVKFVLSRGKIEQIKLIKHMFNNIFTGENSKDVSRWPRNREKETTVITNKYICLLMRGVEEGLNCSHHQFGWTDPLIPSRNKLLINYTSTTIDHNSSVCAVPYIRVSLRNVTISTIYFLLYFCLLTFLLSLKSSSLSP